MKRIAVIGSGSFLARNFIKHSVDNGLDYQFELYDYCEQDDCPQFHFNKIDFSDPEDVKRIDFSVDVIMIFIGKTGTAVGFDNFKAFIEVNEIMLLNILTAYVELKSKARIIYPSSRLVFKSNESKLIDEDGERECKSVYAITKQAAEEYLTVYADAFGAEIVILRICTPIGTLLHDFGHYGTFEIFKNQALQNKEITVFGDGSQRKTFTWMNDICRAFTKIIEKESILFRDYNLGGQALSLLQIAEKIAKEYHVDIKHVPWPEIYLKVDGGSVVFDSARFDGEFGMTYSDIIRV